MISYMRKRSEIRAATELSRPVTRIRSNSSYLIETPIIRFILEHVSCSAHKLLTELHGAVRRRGVCGLVTRRLLASLCACDVSVLYLLPFYCHSRKSVVIEKRNYRYFECVTAKG